MGEKEVPYSNLINLDSVRGDLELPSQLVAELSKLAGHRLVKIYPGYVQTTDGQGAFFSINVRIENVYRGLARAYDMAGEPVPQEVLEKIEKWDREHGLK